jgi:hypothetical protein
MNLSDLEAEEALIRREIAEYLTMANQAHVCLVTFGQRLGRLEERMDALRAERPDFGDRCEGRFGPTSDCPPVLPERLS